jgi:hypothetical protein
LTLAGMPCYKTPLTCATKSCEGGKGARHEENESLGEEEPRAGGGYGGAADR